MNNRTFKQAIFVFPIMFVSVKENMYVALKPLYKR